MVAKVTPALRARKDAISGGRRFVLPSAGVSRALAHPEMQRAAVSLDPRSPCGTAGVSLPFALP